MALEFISSRPDPNLLDLPWRLPLEEWPEDILAALPRGISRHVVRFVRLGGKIVAIKEIKADIAVREYNMLRNLRRLEMPSVEPYAVVLGREDADGEPLDACLITLHLQFSLPYRVLYSQNLRKGTAIRLIDALAVLLVRLHLAGFWWGDVSLSNTLFRRDAGAFAAYLVDAETGELMDLEAGGLLQEDRDPIAVSNRIVERYHELWEILTGSEDFALTERWRVDERVRRLNKLGFDVDELAMTTDIDGTRITIQPKVVDAGHHSRRLLRLTGIDVRENQARRLLNDLDSYRVDCDRQNDDEEIVAHDWVEQIYLPFVRRIPPALRAKLEPAEVFHEVLEHRWYMAERAQHDFSITEAMDDYFAKVLPGKPDEQSVVGVDTTEMPVVAED
jgi:hypothetical protein